MISSSDELQQNEFHLNIHDNNNNTSDKQWSFTHSTEPIDNNGINPNIENGLDRQEITFTKQNLNISNFMENNSSYFSSQQLNPHLTSDGKFGESQELRATNPELEEWIHSETSTISKRNTFPQLYECESSVSTIHPHIETPRNNTVLEGSKSQDLHNDSIPLSEIKEQQYTSSHNNSYMNNMIDINTETSQIDQQLSNLIENIGENDIKLTNALEAFYRRLWHESQQSSTNQNQVFALSRIKKAMKLDDDVESYNLQISTEAAMVMEKLCQIFMSEIGIRSSISASSKNRKVIQRDDISESIQQNDTFDFLLDIVPQSEINTERILQGTTSTNQIPKPIQTNSEFLFQLLSHESSDEIPNDFLDELLDDDEV